MDANPDHFTPLALHVRGNKIRVGGDQWCIQDFQKERA